VATHDQTPESAPSPSPSQPSGPLSGGVSAAAHIGTHPVTEFPDAASDPWGAAFAAHAHDLQPSQIRSLFAVASRPEVVSLAGGMPYVAALNMDHVAEAVATMLRDRGTVALQYGSCQGHPELREQILDVMAPHGIKAGLDDVVVTAGSQLALDLVIRVMCDRGDVILTESPSYVGALGVFTAAGLDVVHVPMDEQGLRPDALTEAITRVRAEGRNPKLLYTIPSYHNPGGVTQSPQRRREVLAAARSAGILIVEDDPYGLLGFDGVVPRALHADDPEGVVYLGSFSKTIAAGVRLGWAVAPPRLREKLVLAAEAATLCPSNFTQLTISTLLSTRPFFDQVARFRDVYRERRDALLDEMAASFPAGTTWTTPIGGFYSWISLPEGIDSGAMLPRAIDALVAYVPGTGFYADGQGRSELRLSYCYPESERVREGVRRLAGVLREEITLRDAGLLAPAR
jgi:2-aminoadipate transaminase